MGNSPQDKIPRGVGNCITLRSLEDYKVDRLGVEASQGVQLTSTNRPNVLSTLSIFIVV